MSDHAEPSEQELPPGDVVTGTVLEEHQHTHVLSWQLLVGVWIALMGFTGLTVYQATLDLGGFDLQIAMFIATCKALLVALIFMHLRWDRPFNGMVFLSSLVFAGLFVAISMLDTTSNQARISERQIDQPLGLRPDYASTSTTERTTRRARTTGRTANTMTPRRATTATRTTGTPITATTTPPRAATTDPGNPGPVPARSRA